MPLPIASARWSILVLALSAFTGCAPEPEIRSYTIPQDPDHKPFRSAAPEEPKVRMFAAMIPSGAQEFWFVRLSGPIDRVTALEKDFDAFLNSIRVTGQPTSPLSWTVPAGWKVGPPNPNRVVTLQYAAADPKPLELYISKPFGGTRLSNVNRWLGDPIGLPPIEEGELGQFTSAVQLGNVTATRVDLSGPGARKSEPKRPGSTN